MSQWISTLSYVGLLSASASLFGWGHNNIAEPNLSIQTPIGFPLNADQGWFVKESYLIMRPNEEDLDYADHVSVDRTDSELNMHLKPKKPDFEWFSGVRMGLGRYLPNHDAWDVTFFTTYFYANEEDHSSPNRNKGATLTPLWIPHFTGNTTKGSVDWRLNYFTWDLSFGREFGLMKTLIAHPYIGLRAALINRIYNVKYADHLFIPAGFGTINNSIDRTITDRFKADNDYWGIGPRLGADFTFTFKNGWAFLGNFSGTILFGASDVEEKIYSKTVLNTVPTLQTFKTFDDRYTVRANLEGSFGIGWEAWVRNHTVRIAPSVLFEATTWFDANQLFEVREGFLAGNNPLLISNFGAARRQGDLTLMGFSVNLQVDF